MLPLAKEILLSMFNRAIKDAKTEASFSKTFGPYEGAGDEPGYLRFYLVHFIKAQSRTLRVIATFETYREDQIMRFELAEKLWHIASILTDFTPEQIDNLLILWGDESTDIDGTIHSARVL